MLCFCHNLLRWEKLLPAQPLLCSISLSSIRNLLWHIHTPLYLKYLVFNKFTSWYFLWILCICDHCFRSNSITEFWFGKALFSLLFFFGGGIISRGCWSFLFKIILIQTVCLSHQHISPHQSCSFWKESRILW